ncbi:MAG TPA: cytidine deaminase [Gemmatimonadaceae bacterium]|nr:cytidine deaminase [Gemmatimonadaceae bacterium]
MTRPARAGAPSLESARAAALAAMERAYAPYSDFRVGAVLVGADGSVFAGCNVENSAYPAGICAERAALAAAVAGGVRRFDLLVVVTEADEPTPPCGMCRQALVEFAPDLAIVSCTTHGGEAQWRLAALFPHPFTPAALSHHP